MVKVPSGGIAGRVAATSKAETVDVTTEGTAYNSEIVHSAAASLEAALKVE